MHNGRRPTKRKLWEITAYKHTEQHISDSDDDKEKIRKDIKKKSSTEIKNTVLENWISHGSSFSCREEFKRNENCNPAFASEEEALIEIVSCSDDDSLHNSQLSISEISHSSDNSGSFCTKQTIQYDFSDDSSDYLMPTAISDITEDSQKNSRNEQARNIPFTISPSSSPTDSSNLNAKGSEWLSTIPWQPTTQKEFHPEIEHCSDKKKKYINDGFADQLHRLQSREKTAKAFWNHHTHEPKNEVYGKESLILKLTEAECSNGIVVCRAISLKSQYLSSLDNDASLTANNITSEERYEDCIVLLDYEQYEKLNISTGSVVQLFPPWKSICVTNLAKPVLLCTYFLQVLKKTDHLFLQENVKNKMVTLLE